MSITRIKDLAGISVRRGTSYFENLDRICAPEYTPNDQDILRNRVSTTGVVELRLTIQGRPFRLCQTMERYL
uniref:Uncharacterized protein n=1 Tax=Romanomermis culicivorax TaxID=13658 RepID=A0A915KY12_ROMCU